MQKESITHSFIIQNFKSTYQATSTNQISEAYSILKQISFDHYGHFMKLTQQILQEQSYKNKNLCFSIVNFIQKLTETFVQERVVKPTGPKLYCTCLQHLFDNQKINYQLKQRIAAAYIKMANYFLQNYQRLVGKIKFYYDTNKYFQALALSRAFILESTFKNKAKSHFYDRSFPALLQKTCLQIQQYLKKSQIERQKTLWILQQFILTIYTCLKKVVFQKYESVLFPLFQKKEIIFIFQNIKWFHNNMRISTLLKKIMFQIISNLGRIRLLQKFQQLLSIFKVYLYEEWHFFMNNVNEKSCCFQNNEIQVVEVRDKQLTNIKMFISAFQYNIIIWNPDQKQIFSTLLTPIYQISQKILFSNQDYQQKLNMLEDSIYWLKSQCVQVCFLKLLRVIILNQQTILNKIMTIINEALFIQSGQKYLQKKDRYILTSLILNFIIFEVHVLMRNQTFLQSLEGYFNKIFQNQFDKDEKFHAYYLLIYRNYMDQIFLRNDTLFISKRILNQFFYVRNQQLNFDQKISNRQEFILQIQKQILIEHFKTGFSKSDIQDQINLVIQFFQINFDEFSLFILRQIILNYSFPQKRMLNILEKGFEDTNKEIQMIILNLKGQKEKVQNFNLKIKSLFEVLQVFFKVKNWKDSFQYILQKTVKVIKYVNKQDYIDNLIQITKNSIANLQYIPHGFTEIIIELFDLRSIKSLYSFQALSVILKFSKKQQSTGYCILQSKYQNQILINNLLIKLVSILRKCTFSDYSMDNLLSKLSLNSKNAKVPKYYKRQIPALIVTHQIIYYHSYAITQKTIQQLIQTTKQILQQKLSQFNHVNGKYLLIFLFLMKYRFNSTMKILQKLDIVGWVFDHVYKCQNQYRIQYDTPTLLFLQIYIFKNFLKNQWIMKYLNVSFLCLFYSIDRLFVFKQNPINFDSQSDQQLQPEKPYKSQLKQIWKIIQKMDIPDQLKLISELDLYGQYIKQLLKNQRTKQWVNIIVNKALNSKQKKHFYQIIKLENIGNKIRLINKVNRTDFQNFKVAL